MITIATAVMMKIMKAADGSESSFMGQGVGVLVGANGQGAPVCA